MCKSRIQVVRGFKADAGRTTLPCRDCIRSSRRRACFDNARHASEPARGAFTLVELLVVIVILGFAAAIAVPMMSSAASFQIRSAGNKVAADLEYAKSMAISRGENHSVIFDAVNESYQIEDSSGTVIDDPVRPGKDYVVDFTSDSRLDEVDIQSASFDGAGTVTFDYLGSPFNSGGGALNSGTLTLKAGDYTKTVSVEPVTGFISVSD